MTTKSKDRKGFSLLELLMAMAIFVIAAVSLSRAINLISFSVVESVDNAVLREQLRSVLLEESRKPNLREGTRETPVMDNDVSFRIEITPHRAENREGISLEDLFEISVTAQTQDQVRGTIELDSASTVVNPRLFQAP